MANLKDLEGRIASVKTTQKITIAMKMVAAAKLRRAQEGAECLARMPSVWTVWSSRSATSVGDTEGGTECCPAPAETSRCWLSAPSDRGCAAASTARLSAQ